VSLNALFCFVKVTQHHLHTSFAAAQITMIALCSRWRVSDELVSLQINIQFELSIKFTMLTFCQAKRPEVFSKLQHSSFGSLACKATNLHCSKHFHDVKKSPPKPFFPFILALVLVEKDFYRSLCIGLNWPITIFSMSAIGHVTACSMCWCGAPGRSFGPTSSRLFVRFVEESLTGEGNQFLCTRM